MAKSRSTTATTGKTGRVDAASTKESSSVVANQKVAKRAVDPAVLRALAGDIDPRVRVAVASNSATPPAVLRALARDAIVDVTAAVAQNPKAPPGLLEKLASSKLARIRLRVAKNPGAPIDVLRSFLRGHEPPLKNAALQNPALPFADRLAFAESDVGRYYRYHVVADERVPPGTVAAWVRTAAQFCIEDQQLLDLVLARDYGPPILHALVVGQAGTVWGSRALGHPEVDSDMLLEIAETLDPECWRKVIFHPRADRRVLAAGLAVVDDLLYFDDADALAALTNELGNIDRYAGAPAAAPRRLVIESLVACTVNLDESAGLQLRRLSWQYTAPVSRLRVVPTRSATAGWSLPLSPAGGRHNSLVEVEGHTWAPSFVIEADDQPPAVARPDSLTLSLSKAAADALRGTSIRWSIRDQHFYYGTLAAIEASAHVPGHVVVIP